MDYCYKMNLFFLFLFVGTTAILAPTAYSATSSHERLMEQAHNAITESRYQQAALYLQKILADDPSNIRAINLLEKAFQTKIRRQKIEDALKKYINKKNYIAAKAKYKELKKEAPQHPRLDHYHKRLQELKETNQFSVDRLQLSADKKAKRDRLFRQGQKALKDGRYRQAINSFQELLQIAPGDLKAKEALKDAQRRLALKREQKRLERLLKQGKNYFEQGELLSAQKNFETILESNPRHEEAVKWLNKVKAALDKKKEKQSLRLQAQNLYQEGNAYMKQKEYKKAIEAYESVLSLIEGYKDTKSRLDLAQKNRKQKYIREQKQQAEEIAQYMRNGLSDYYAENYKGAVANLDKVLKLDPDNEQAKDMISRAQEALKIKSQEQVSESSPFYPVLTTFAQKARNHYRKGNYQEAKKSWREILRLFPKNRMAQQGSLKCDKELDPRTYRQAAGKIIQEGKKFLQKKSYNRARKKFMLIYKIDPNFPGLKNLIARTKQQKQQASQPKMARSKLRRYYQRALALYRQQRYQKAKELLTIVVKNDPRDYKAAAALARLRKMMAINPQGSSASAPKTRLSAAQKKQVRQLYILGLTRYSNNQYQAAIRAWQRVLRIDPNHSRAKANIRRVRRSLQS